jgi:hypothetical protein
MKAPHPRLEGCLQTKLKMADGERVVFFHMNPLSEEDKATLEELTGKEFEALLAATFEDPMLMELHEDPSNNIAIRLNDRRFG